MFFGNYRKTEKIAALQKVVAGYDAYLAEFNEANILEDVRAAEAAVATAQGEYDKQSKRLTRISRAKVDRQEALDEIQRLST
jgi:hypothetical protein